MKIVRCIILYDYKCAIVYTVRPCDARFLGKEKMSAAENSCNYWYLIGWREDDQKKRAGQGLNRVDPTIPVCEWGRVGLVREGCKQGPGGLALRVKIQVRGRSGWFGCIKLEALVYQ